MERDTAAKKEADAKAGQSTGAKSVDKSAAKPEDPKSKPADTAAPGTSAAKPTDTGATQTKAPATPSVDPAAVDSGTSKTPDAVKTPDATATTATSSNDKPAGDSPAAKGKKILLGSPELTAGIPGEGELKIEEIKAWLDDPKNHETLDIELPLGLSAGAGQVVGLDKNPLTRAKIELGRQLYFDPRLSYDQTISCATCHDPDEGYAKRTKTGIGIGKQAGGRNSPTAYNRILSGAQFWDGRAPSLEDQAVGPIANPIEMGNNHEACVKCLEEIEGYKIQFHKIFGELNIDTVGKALASFERAIVTGPTPFDYYERVRQFEKNPQSLEDLKEDDEAAYARVEKWIAEAKAHPMSEEAKRGRELFFSDKASCTACHVGPNLTDEKYHNLGVGMMAEKPDVGRFEVTKDPKDTGAFKTPTIRNVALTAPYMHDGSQATLEEVVEWYAKGGHPNPHLSDKIKKLELTDQDKKDLVAFMNACTGEFPKVQRGRLPAIIK